MSGEIKNGYLDQSSQLEKTKDKLHRYSLFSKKDFASPSDILSQANRVAEKRIKDKKWTYKNTFFIFHDYAKTGDPKDIRYNDLLSIIFSFDRPEQSNKNPQKNDWGQSEITDVINSLSGENSDFILNKKNFLLTRKVLPAYLVMRSFKEKDSKWFDTILSGFNQSERNEILNRTLGIKQNLSAFIDTPSEKKALKTQFENSLEVEKVSRTAESLSPKEIEELKRIAKAVMYTPFIEKSKEKPKQIYIYNYKELPIIRLKTEKNKKGATNFGDLELIEKTSKADMFIPENVLKALTVDLSQNSFLIPIRMLSKIGKDFDLHSLTSVLDPPDLAAFFALNTLSTENKYSHFDLPTEKDKPIISAFIKTYKDVIKNKKKFKELLMLYQLSLGNDLSFSRINQEITGLLYKSMFNKPHTPSRLISFLNTPYCKKAVLALKKLLLIQMVEKNIHKKEILKYSEIQQSKQLGIDLILEDGRFISRKERKRRELLESLE